MSNEVKQKRKKKRKLSIQKIFNLMSAMFILACCIFYGTRFITLYLDNNKPEKIKVLADKIRDNNSENNNFKNISGDYYFEGNDVNNYLKYSNLIWRIIRVNSNDTVTLVLDNSITTLAAKTKSYTNSYINMWLNKSDKEFTGILENNLNKTNNYLTYSNTCNDTIDDTKNITCKKHIENLIITVPSLSDYVNTGGQKGFMNNKEYYYLINTNKEGKLWYIDENGVSNTTDGSDILGIKPVITIKKNIKLISGNGSQNNPYIIEEENGLFGSYVKLENDIWRIYSVEENTIKLSLDSYLTIKNNDVRYKYSTSGYNYDNTKQGSLAYYLKNTYLPTLEYKNIINETRYSNSIYSNITDFDYTKVLNTKIDTKIAILSIGDIIVNPTNTNYYISTGISEDSNQMYVFQNNFKLVTRNATTNLKIIPVISINKNLIIGGDGSIDNPLEVAYE